MFELCVESHVRINCTYNEMKEIYLPYTITLSNCQYHKEHNTLSIHAYTFFALMCIKVRVLDIVEIYDISSLNGIV